MVKLCECGCGEPARSRFLRGHNRRGAKMPPMTEERRRKLSEAQRGERGSSWKGGRRANDCGYILRHAPDHPNARANRCVLEHRLVIEAEIGRYLEPGEVVHHRDEDHSHNWWTNLWFFPSHSAHQEWEMFLRKCERGGLLREEVEVLFANHHRTLRGGVPL